MFCMSFRNYEGIYYYFIPSQGLLIQITNAKYVYYYK